MRASAFQQTLLDYCQDYETAKSLGTAMLACNAMIVPAIAPHIALLIPNAPRPVSTYTEPTEVIFAGGLQAHRSGVPKTSHDGQLQLIETDTGQMAGFAELLMANNGHTDCIVFDGRKDRFTLAYELKDCAITIEPGEIDAEGRNTLMRLNAPIKYMYFGMNANIGSSTQVGQVQNATQGFQDFINKANEVLNVVQAGNSLIRALGSL
ncbi:hypothetical protein ACT4YP_20120 (plasmid) [Acinetobacter baumannii]|uniref:hypothetical protein n=1 Tax=Acinetobacter baumannii TaxID=470 RepID=UPI0030C5BA5D